MIVIGPATENEMILAFLRAEIDSPRYGPLYQQRLSSSGFSRYQLIESPDLNDAPQNTTRMALLRDVRGYSTNLYLFQGFPRDVEWQRIRLDPPKLKRLKYANHPTWTTLSNGTRLVVDGARNIDQVQTAENANDSIKAVAEALKSGHTYPELITVSGPEDYFILVEGHTRATAYILSGYSHPITMLVGRSARMSRWVFY